MSVSAGRNMCFAWSASSASPVASDVGSSSPPIGNQPSDTANSDSSSMPSQNSGIEYSVIVLVVAA